MIKVLLADDHQSLLDGFQLILNADPEIEVSVLCRNGKEVLEALKTTSIDIVLMDINMPELNGIETCKIITKKFPAVKVVALTMHKKSSYIKRMLQFGAKGYLLKDDSGQQIIEGVKAVHRGQTFLSLRVKDIALSFGLDNNHNSISELTKREIEVLELISKGFTNSEIANTLFLSAHTVESHRRNMLAKLDAKNTPELIRLAIEKGWI